MVDFCNLYNAVCFHISAERVHARFRNMRTDHIKLHNFVKSCKSGSKAKPLTTLQRFKLREYAFIQEHYRPRTKTLTVGSVSICKQ